MGGAKIVQFIAALVQVGLAIAIIVVVQQNLWWQVPYSLGTCYTNFWGALYCTGEWVCLMTDSSTNICSYTWWTAGVSILVSIMLAMTQTMRNRYSRGCPVAAVLLALFGLGWWIANGVVTTVNANNIDDKDLPEDSVPPYANAKNDRIAVYAMAWAQVGMFAISTLVALADCRSKPQHAPADAYPPGTYVAPGYQAAAPYGSAYPPPGYPPATGYPAGGVPPPPPMSYPPPGVPTGSVPYPPPQKV